jgi:hypothetical protein
MRTTRSLIVVAATIVAAAALLGPDADQRTDPSDEPRLLAAAGAAGDPDAGWPSGFDGRLWADPETGCFHLVPPEGTDPRWGLAEADLEVVPAPEPGDGPQPPAVPAPDPPSDEGLGMTRGPWPLCDHPGTMVQLAPDSP